MIEKENTIFEKIAQAIHEDIVSLSRKFDGLQGDFLELRGNFTGLQKSFTELENNFVGLENNFVGLKDYMDYRFDIVDVKLDKKFGDITGEFEIKDEEIQRLHRVDDGLNQRIMTLEKNPNSFGLPA